MRNLTRLAATVGAAVLVTLATGAERTHAAGARPSAAVLIAAAKNTKLAEFEVMEELRPLKVEAWLKKLGDNRPIAWRSKVCRAKVEERDKVNAPICVEAAIRFDKGVVLTVGIGFDEEAARPQEKPNTIWGAISIRGAPCDFLRHPDQIHLARKAIDDIVKAGGRCR